MRNGVELYRSTPVTNIEKIDGGWQLTTPNGSFAARYVVNAAGLNAQAIHEIAAPHTFTLEPTRGEYYLLDKSEGNRVNHVIFQCPNENGKGVLVTPTVHGNLLVGPNAQPVAGMIPPARQTALPLWRQRPGAVCRGSALASPSATLPVCAPTWIPGTS